MHRAPWRRGSGGIDDRIDAGLDGVSVGGSTGGDWGGGGGEQKSIGELLLMLLPPSQAHLGCIITRENMWRRVLTARLTADRMANGDSLA